jgi:small basic protein (TIGR04137 family)
MSQDKSLRSKSGLVGHRNVLNRAERLKKLEEDGKWKDSESVYGLPKVRVAKMARRAKAVKKEVAAVPGAEGVAAAPAAEAGKAGPAAAGAKGAPAAAGKAGPPTAGKAPAAKAPAAGAKK